MHAGYTGKIQVMKKLIINCKAMCYPCTIIINNNQRHVILVNLKQFAKIAKIKWR